MFLVKGFSRGKEVLTHEVSNPLFSTQYAQNILLKEVPGSKLQGYAELPHFAYIEKSIVYLKNSMAEYETYEIDFYNDHLTKEHIYILDNRLLDIHDYHTGLLWTMLDNDVYQPVRLFYIEDAGCVAVQCVLPEYNWEMFRHPPKLYDYESKQTHTFIFSLDNSRLRNMLANIYNEVK